MSKLSIRKAIRIKASAEAVFDALTSSDEIVQYFPLQRVTSSWQAGGSLLMEGVADGRAFADHGVIRELDRPATFAYTYWSDNHGTDNVSDKHVAIRYSLYPEGAVTRLEMTQSNLPSPEYRAVMEDAWTGLLESLKSHVESRS